MSELSVFNFDTHAVRTLTRDGDPWFVAADVCEVLTIGNNRDAVARLDDDEKADVGITDISSNGTAQGRSVTIINESGLYSLILTSRKPEAKRFKKWVTSEVLPSIRKTGGYTPPQQPITEATAALSFWDAAVRSLNMAPSAHLGGVRAIAASYGYDALLPHLPVYAIDAPTTATSAPTSSMPTASLTDLLREHEIDMAAVTANKLLAQAGIIEQLTRPSSKGAAKKFWSVTEKGSIFGKNVTSPNNPKETQPHWYRQCAKTLIETYLLK